MSIGSATLSYIFFKCGSYCYLFHMVCDLNTIDTNRQLLNSDGSFGLKVIAVFLCGVLCTV